MNKLVIVSTLFVLCLFSLSQAIPLESSSETAESFWRHQNELERLAKAIEILKARQREILEESDSLHQFDKRTAHLAKNKLIHANIVDKLTTFG